MATYIETRIIEALFTRLKSLIFSPVLPVSWPNKSLTPPTDGKWLRVNDLPAPVRVFGIAEVNEYLGVLQIDVMWPLETGVTAPKEIAGQIINHFSARSRIAGDGLIINVISASLGAKIEDLPRVMFPVSINYRVFS